MLYKRQFGVHGPETDVEKIEMVRQPDNCVWDERVCSLKILNYKIFVR